MIKPKSPITLDSILNAETIEVIVIDRFILPVGHFKKYGPHKTSFTVFEVFVN